MLRLGVDYHSQFNYHSYFRNLENLQLMFSYRVSTKITVEEWSTITHTVCKKQIFETYVVPELSARWLEETGYDPT